MLAQLLMLMLMLDDVRRRRSEMLLGGKVMLFTSQLRTRILCMVQQQMLVERIDTISFWLTSTQRNHAECFTRRVRVWVAVCFIHFIYQIELGLKLQQVH